MVGFGYGYVSKPGQWWHELASRRHRPQAGSVLDDRRLRALRAARACRPTRGNRIGRRLLLQLAEGLTNRTLVLSTPDADTRAFRMYRSLGFVDLPRGHIFPGDFATVRRARPDAPVRAVLTPAALIGPPSPTHRAWPLVPA
jgi:hypothetical protein